MNAPPPPQSWRPDEEDSLKWVKGILDALSLLAGPVGPLLVAGGEYLYRRRHLIFGPNGQPLQAVSLTGDPPPVTDGRSAHLEAAATLGGPGVRQQVLSVVPQLDSPARRSGLRDGDPVSLLLAGRTGPAQSNGLVIPARIGQRLDVTVPSGEYAIAGMGSSRDTLFTARDPVRAAGGLWLPAGNHPTAPLALQARSALTPPTGKLPECRYCHRPVADPIGHPIFCPSRSLPYRCDICGKGFSNQYPYLKHQLEEHAPLGTGQRSCPDCGSAITSIGSAITSIALHKLSGTCSV
ncbi:C2H2-type zinc finger protein [Streptomyces sp. NPDC048710]|uniref:C2H2-type zinc finger protein n=1 Tax=Streptomyces sp. NPDC048710 TaxID=3365586 RepID=UPI00371E11AF